VVVNSQISHTVFVPRGTNPKKTFYYTFVTIWSL